MAALNDVFKSYIGRSPFDTILAVGHGKESLYIQEIKNRAPYIDPCRVAVTGVKNPGNRFHGRLFCHGMRKSRVIGKSDRVTVRAGDKWRPIGGHSSPIRIVPRAFLRFCSLWMEGYLRILTCTRFPRFRLSSSRRTLRFFFLCTTIGFLSRLSF